ncbi:MAG: hypothetical protein K2L45_10455, partial [Muribaculaceae bacterium]|nr:hypothetical protein [Muribaculaceae bacterium]
GLSDQMSQYYNSNKAEIEETNNEIEQIYMQLNQVNEMISQVLNASNAQIEELNKEIEALKAKVEELEK